MKDQELDPSTDEGHRDVTPDDPEEQMLYLRRLRGRYGSECGRLTDQELSEQVTAALQCCPDLEIRNPLDVLRFVALKIFHEPSISRSALLRQVMHRVLHATDAWSATKRLDFIYKHIVGRPAPNPEPDFGPWYVEQESQG